MAQRFFAYHVPRSVLLRVMQAERGGLGRADGRPGWSDEGVRVSVLLDLDRGQTRPIRQYARLWGWSQRFARQQWPQIQDDVVEWATSGGRLSHGRLPIAAMAWRDKQRERSARMRRVAAGRWDGRGDAQGNAPGDAQRDAEITDWSAQGVPSDAQVDAGGDARAVRHTRTEPTDRTEPPPADAREAEPAVDEVPPDGPSPPDRRACRVLFSGLKSVSPERADLMADHFFDHYAARGWTRGPDLAPYARAGTPSPGRGRTASSASTRRLPPPPPSPLPTRPMAHLRSLLLPLASPSDPAPASAPVRSRPPAPSPPPATRSPFSDGAVARRLPVSEGPIVALAGGSLTQAEVDRLGQSATVQGAAQAVARVCALHGHEASAERVATLASALADPEERWTQPELESAARALARCPRLGEAIRYGRTVTLADFERMRTGDAGAGRERLVGYYEALRQWQRAGSPGRFPGSLFEVVARRGEGPDAPLLLRRL